jgi:fructose-specific phosphotransferase system IIC component
VTFSPWNRDVPGFIDGIPSSHADFAGSLAFGAIVGGVLGLAFWYFYKKKTSLGTVRQRRELRG